MLKFIIVSNILSHFKYATHIIPYCICMLQDFYIKIADYSAHEMNLKLKLAKFVEK